MLPVGASQERGGLPEWSELRALALAAEREGLDSVWLADHFFFQSDEGHRIGMHEAWTLLSAIAAVTERIRLGPLVLCGSFRNPGLLATMAVTLDRVAGGRLVLGLGAGWHDPEYEAYGYPTDHRVGRFAELLAIVTRLLDGERFTFEGRFHRVHDAALDPAPERRIPVLIAAKGPRMLELTARFADAWNTAWFGLPDRLLAERLSEFEAAAERQGRENAIVPTVGLSVQDISHRNPESDAEPIEAVAEAIAHALGEYADLGFGHAMVHLDPRTTEMVERLAEGVRLFRAQQAPG